MLGNDVIEPPLLIGEFASRLSGELCEHTEVCDKSQVAINSLRSSITGGGLIAKLKFEIKKGLLNLYVDI